jgi:V/A-type H+/Na+-transporting ATPase subunit C
MSGLTAYAYLDTRVSIRAEGLLAPARLAELATRPDAELAEILREAGYVEMAENQPATPRDLEQRILDDYIDDITVLIRPLKDAARDFLSYWKHRYEIINLKRCIRHHLLGLPPAALRDQLVELGPTSELPVDELTRAEDVEELLRRLEGTAYGDMVRQARRVYEERHTLFDLEAALDRQYYSGLVARFEQLPERDRQPLAELVGALADQLNLTWLLRYRFAFGLEPAHVYLLLITPGRFLGKTQLLELVQKDGLEAVLAALPAPFSELLAGLGSIVAVEKAMDLRTQRIARRMLAYTRFTLARAFAYLVLRERQILKIHVALKGRQLGLDQQTIRIASGLPEDFLASVHEAGT